MKIQSDNPIGAAKELHYLIGWTCPADFTIEEIANALGVIVKEVPIKGSEGRILIKGETGIVSVSNAITHYGKKNFVIGHEIGHFILHKNLTSLFSDTHKTLLEWHKKGVHEQQANEFASELLMPEVLFKSKIAGKKLNIGLIEFIPYNSSVPAWTVAGDYFNRNVLEAKPVKVNAIEWFPEDFQIKYKQDWKLWEQCYQVSNRGLISCLWTY
jgi:hypothetical protein